MLYRENKEKSEKYKQEYLDGINFIIEQKQKEAANIRKSYIKDIFENQEKYRSEFKEMLGWPLSGYTPQALPDVMCEELSIEDGYSIYRMQFEILNGLKMTGLFFKMHDADKKPLVIVQHGGLGTPELISGVYGDTSNYNAMLERVIKHKVHAFAPQLLLWNQENYGITFDRKEIDARLKRVGSSITALEVYGITRILDYFETKEYVSNFGMVGLSYGGFYTLYTTAIDTRIKSAISCSFFNKRDAYPWTDWTWFKSAEKFDDAEIACLIYPRHICIEIGNNDELFDYKTGVESFEYLKDISSDVGMNWAQFIIFDGTHEFCKSDEPIEKLIQDIK